MGLFEGKTPTERNKMIAAAVLGVVALFALYFAFGRSLIGGGSATATAKSSPTPKADVSLTINRPVASLPTASEQDFYYQTTAVQYPGNVFAPDPGRNIFAFYEPPEKCRGDNCPPSPIPSPSPVKPPTPLPSPPILVTGMSPTTVYAGARAFRLELNGDKFAPDQHIYFDQKELPTTFINTQKVVADVPAKYFSTEGSRQVIVQTPDGKLYSNQMMLTVQVPPKPTVFYIGMIGRKRYNNDTAYFTETEKSPPFGARLNDVLNGRFRLVDISPAEVVLEDVGLGFRHRVPISKGIMIGSMPPGRGTDPNEGGGINNPNVVPPQTDIPGIPNNVQRFSPQQMQEQRKLEQQKKEDVDDEGND